MISSFEHYMISSHSNSLIFFITHSQGVAMSLVSYKTDESQTLLSIKVGETVQFNPSSGQ